MLSTRRSVPILVALCAIGVFTARPAAAATPSLAGSTVQRGYAADGRLNFIGSASDPLDLPPGTAASFLPGRGNAGSFVSLYGPAFGLRDPGNQVALNREDSWADGRATSRYRQVHNGVPVFGGDLVVNTDARGRLVAMAGKVSPNLDVDTTPGVTAADATATAQAALTAAYGAGFAGEVTEAAALWIYDESLLTESEAAPNLVWKMEISGLPTHPVREVVLVDAQTGSVVLRFNQIDTQWRASRGAATTLDLGCTSNEFATPPTSSIVKSAGFAKNDTWSSGLEVCNQGNYPTNCNDLNPTDPDATLAFLYSANTWEFFNVTHTYEFVTSVTAGTGIKSLINIGPARGNVDWYQNAYWDGEKMNYGDGFAEAEDVVAHEMTHGVTEHTSKLLYLYQSGAINESLSDLWGEFVDQSYVNSFCSERDAAANKWYLGEDLPGIGAIRNMANPPLYKDPDKMTSSYYYRGPLDNGGVHTNSGINNKAAYLMANGGTFNGYTVNALGIATTAQIYFLAQTKYLFDGADYYDLFNALDAACAELKLVKADLDCVNVRRATKAVQMDMRPATISTGVVAQCPTGTVYGKTVFFDSFESVNSPTDNWQLSAVKDTGGPITPSWSLVYYGFSDALTNDDLVALYAGGFGYYEGCGSPMGCFGQESAAMKNAVSIPPTGQKTHFSFEHTYLFENWGAERYDGGVVEYSTDVVPWTDLRARFSAGQNYNGVVMTGWGNPLSGRPAFVANSRGGKVFTRYDLTPLAGQNVKIRFRIGYDFSFDWGWFIDRVDIHTCVPAPAKPVLLAPASGALVYDYTPTLQWADALRADSYEIQIFSDAKMLNTVEAQTGLPGLEFTPATLDANVRYYWRVRSVANNDKPGYSAWTALRSFRTALTPPTQLAPTAGTDTRTDRPTFSWEPSVGASSYLWQVCGNEFCTQIVKQGTVRATQATPSSDLPVNATLFWRVLANGTNRSAWSEIWSFTTGNPPTIPVLLAPAANLLTFDTTPTFTWKLSLLAEGTSGPLSYNIQLATDALFTNVVAHLDNTALTEMTMDAGSPLSNAWTCYWRVQSVNGSGGTAETSGWSTPRALRIGYATPTLLAPANAGPTGSNTVVFDWDVTGENNPTNYTIQFSVNDTFSPLLASGTAVPSTYTRTFTQAGTVYWRVRANGSYGPSSWSAPFNFVLP